MKTIVFLLSLLLVIFPVYGQVSADSETEIMSTYTMTVDEHIFLIPYYADTHVLAMAIDPELTSLLIGLTDTRESLFVIDLNHEIVDAENNQFVVLVNGYEVDYTVTSDADSSKLSFYVPDFTEEVEIIGTHVIPEFPFGVILIFTILVATATVATKAKKLPKL